MPVSGRRRSWIATIVAIAFVLTSAFNPASAVISDGVPSRSALDIMAASCGTTPSRQDAHRLAVELAEMPRQIAQVSPVSTESPASIPVTSASGGLAASPAPSGSPSPGASPSPSAYPNVNLPPAPAGPVILRPPPPSPVLTPFPSAQPLPTPTPNAGASAPVYLERTTPPPSPTPTPQPKLTIGPVTSPKPSPSPEPSAVPTLGPNQYAILADQLVGSQAPGQPLDAIGDVNIFYAEGIVVGDRAHYDGARFIDVTGNAYLRQRDSDSILRSDVIRFDTLTQQAYLSNSRGETTRGVERGKLYFTAQTLTSQRSGVANGENATITTCENPHGGYHIVAKSLEIRPGDKAIARKATLFLGPLAIFYLPLVVIPLVERIGERRRDTGFLPVMGYSQAEGFYVKARIGFGTTDYYYGYYRIDAYTKLGFGLGYVAFFRRKDNRRAVDVDFYRFRNKQDGSQQNNLNLTDNENFSQRLQGQLTLRYIGNYGPLITLPPSYSLGGTIRHTGLRESQSYTFLRSTTGGQQSSINLGFIDQRQLTDKLSQGFTVDFTNNSNSYAGSALTSSTLHFNTLTRYSAPLVDYELAYDKTEAQQPSGIERVPELSIRPHPLFQRFRMLPITSSLVIGQYTEPQSQLTSTRGELLLNLGPSLARVFGSDFSGTVNIRQDAYATGDLKAQIQQNASLSTPIGRHIINAITYNEQNSNGPAFEPFKTLDPLAGSSHGAQDVLRIFNNEYYALSLSTGTNFNRQAQPIAYTINTRPSPRSSLSLGGSYVPGPGNGFFSTNVQVITPFGRDTDLQFTTNVDWKNHMRLESKNIYLRKIIGQCYEILASYNQDLKQINFGVSLLAFPSRAANFGIGQSGPIIPQSFNF